MSLIFVRNEYLEFFTQFAHTLKRCTSSQGLFSLGNLKLAYTLNWCTEFVASSAKKAIRQTERVLIVSRLA